MEKLLEQSVLRIFSYFIAMLLLKKFLFDVYFN